MIISGTAQRNKMKLYTDVQAMDAPDPVDFRTDWSDLDLIFSRSRLQDLGT